jgi:hypothetical protein
VVTGDSTHGDQTHDLITVLIKQFTLERLGEVVCHHFLGWAILYGNLFASNAIGDKEISYIDMASAAAAGGFTVVGSDGALVVLCHDYCLGAVAMCLHKIFGP